jgi:serine/threonine protein kinase
MMRVSGRANPSSPPPPEPQPPHSTDELKFAKRSLEKLVQDSRFFHSHDRNDRVRDISENDLEYGSIIGKGGFCEVRCVVLKKNDRSQSSGGSGRCDPIDAASPPLDKYAMKYLSPSKTTSSKVFQRGVADLAMEACFLSLLSHDNIVGLHYVSEGSLEENYDCVASSRISGQSDDDVIYMDANGKLQLRRHSPPPSSGGAHLFGYFLLLDPLHETLAERMERTYLPQFLLHDPIHGGATGTYPFQLWDRICHKNNRPQTSAGSCNPLAPQFHLAERLESATCIASALTYLHDTCHIVYRDIKPENIGFQRKFHPHCTCGRHRGTNGHLEECTCYVDVTKLFDFGLAKELKPNYRKGHPAHPDMDTFKLTGCTGSRRYMAPEVCFSFPYNEKADVYSFGILLYQVASLVKPFDGYSMGRHERCVLRDGQRPDVKVAMRNDSFMVKMSPAARTQQHNPTALFLDEGVEEIERKNRSLASMTTRYWPKDLPRLMEECWDGDMSRRPSMKMVTTRLKRFIDCLMLKGTGGGDGGDGIGAGHCSKFSPHNAKVEAGLSLPFASHGTTATSSPFVVSRGGGYPLVSHDHLCGPPTQDRQQQHASRFSPSAPSFNISG